MHISRYDNICHSECLNPMHVFCSVIDKAVKLLQQGELIAFPTETVYGLGGLAINPKAIKNLFAVKARSTQKPLSLLIPDKAHIVYWAKDISYQVMRLAERFWPGPLTILLKPTDKVLETISAHSGRVGLRVPAHPVAYALLSRLGSALAAPSANISGQLSPTTAEAVREQLGEKISFIIEDDSCSVGIESTVIDMGSVAHPVIRRLGAISIQEIENVLDQAVIVDAIYTKEEHHPGILVKWVSDCSDYALTVQADSKTAILNYSKIFCVLPSTVTQILMPAEPISYQSYIYKRLYELKKQGYRTILIERLPNTQAWESITVCLNRWCKNDILPK